MDNVLNYKNFDALKDVFSDQKFRNNIRLLCVFGYPAKDVIYATNEDKVYGFGRNRFGGLGLGTDDQSISPTFNPTLSFKQLSNIFFGFKHWIGLTASGQCFCWGRNDFGQLGIGTVESTSTPQLIETLADKVVVEISCGGFYTLALTSDGQVYGWGRNISGVGFGSNEIVTIPNKIQFEEKIASLSCGSNHSVALTVNRRVYTWGLGDFGQLGRIVKKPYIVIIPQLIPGFEDIYFAKAVCGPKHTLLLTTDGSVYSFGDNNFGQIGNGRQCWITRQKTPFLVSNEIKFKDIIATKENDLSISVSIDGKFYVWGLSNRIIPTPKELISGDSVFDIYAKMAKTCITFKTIVISNELKSWEQIKKSFKQSNVEQNSISHLSTQNIISSVQSLNLTPIKTKRTINAFLNIEDFNNRYLLSIDGKTIESIRLFYVYQRGNSIIYVTNEDRVYGIGYNGNGLLGLDENRKGLRKPELNTRLSGKQLVEIASGFEHCIGLTASGECYSWGNNRYGQLGLGTYETPQLPANIKQFYDKTIVEISCGSYHSMALTSYGEIFSWGRNTSAQLGDTTNSNRQIPTQILIRENISSISCGLNHSLALAISGRVYIWGGNDRGQLGRPIKEEFWKNLQNRPKKITDLDDKVFIKAVCGRNHSLLLTSDGSVYAFGDNCCGQIGNGSTETQSTPIVCNKDLKVKEMITDKENDLSIAVSDKFKVYFWGLAQNRKVTRPELLHNCYGKSLFDIYLKLAKQKVTYKTLDVNEDIEINELNTHIFTGILCEHSKVRSLGHWSN